MSISKEKKQEIMKAFQRKQGDTGSPEVQIAVLTAQINNISEHIKLNQKDFHCRRGLLKQVSRRRSLLDYLKKQNPESYQNVIKSLGLRR
ncbi:30S ribosomal protein S15 [Candidatus Hydrogenosomobacter endosymbioticus]|uniref:Small ribosomal subunit protein uS15 n=1 Tax=Candidatus Hydrogenosomobacter endosymbioticus TaxID=2558174 RepID=A0ABN6L310_9PROT|nr:30S ribosomal protein S15 [Candidatus Hydrogenosomobacter endosymbioticus]BDB96251.1 30S ribosomal protein S15 [Candidatus Hydrogenosomobacter endosymbioticus]